jgi:vacuolar-type H+-ATPase subunit I/STV1
MAIAEMSEILILGRKRDNLEVIRALQDAAVVQIDPLEDGEVLNRRSPRWVQRMPSQTTKN